MFDGSRATLRAYTETYIRIACTFSCNPKATLIFPKGNKGNVNDKEKPFAPEGMNRKLSEEKHVLSSPWAAPFPPRPTPRRQVRSRGKLPTPGKVPNDPVCASQARRPGG